jgi:hypothetical protein
VAFYLGRSNLDEECGGGVPHVINHATLRDAMKQLVLSPDMICLPTA